MKAQPSFHLHRERPKRSAKAIATLERQRNAWHSRLQPVSLFQRLFDHLPGVYFFAKDREGRTMFASRGILELYLMTDEREMLGLTDFDLNPRNMAEHYVADDQLILSGEVKAIERLELWFNHLGLPDWFAVLKMPVLGNDGRPDGVMGVLRRVEEHERQLPLVQAVSTAVTLIRNHFAEPITIATVASQCGQSLRQLQRHFQKTFGITPQEFLLKTRILAAAHLLAETHLTASEISARCGFTDPSGFTHHFTARVGVGPMVYRKQFRAK